MKKLLKWIGLTFLGLIVLGIVIDATKSPEEHAKDAARRQQEAASQAEAKREQDKQELASIPAISPKDLAEAYDANTVAADQQFKGRKFKVTGSVADINTDFMGNPYVTLRAGVNQFMEPQFAFEKSDAAQLAQLKKGSKVTLICTGKGDVAKTPISDSCTLL